MVKSIDELHFYVFTMDRNTNELEQYDIINKYLIDDIAKSISCNYKGKKRITKKMFTDAVKSELMYRYWCKSEWEVIITTWPPHISTREVDRLIAEKDKADLENRNWYSTYVNLERSFKVDVYSQIKLNFDLLMDYLWSNRKLILPKQKKKRNK